MLVTSEILAIMDVGGTMFAEYRIVEFHVSDRWAHGRMIRQEEVNYPILYPGDTG